MIASDLEIMNACVVRRAGDDERFWIRVVFVSDFVAASRLKADVSGLGIQRRFVENNGFSLHFLRLYLGLSHDELSRFHRVLYLN